MANESLQKALSRQGDPWLKASKKRNLKLIISRSDAELAASRKEAPNQEGASQNDFVPFGVPGQSSGADNGSKTEPEVRESVGKSVLSILQTLREQRVRFEQLVGGVRYRQVENIVSHAGAKTQGAILDTYAG